MLEGSYDLEVDFGITDVVIGIDLTAYRGGVCLYIEGQEACGNC